MFVQVLRFTQVFGPMGGVAGSFLKIAYEGKEMRAVADEQKVVDLHVLKLTTDWSSREEYEKFREDLQGKRIHIDAQSASISKRKFDIPISLRVFVMKYLDQKWRSWKYDLMTKFFMPYQKAQQHFACSDIRVVEEQWKKLVQIWSSKEFKKDSETNKQNKSKHTFFHCAGSKSFADIYHEENESLKQQIYALKE
ncbi:hypothetical protein Taro_012340 [Colocasia esculenta]|uniref:Uncharacterized protein n=1 Tax=Colocasia esculenta TaxID=4460 RepID=A0A843U8S8_COLES|nr:hypothetical protein [Colocasia esculenta]